MFSSSTEPEFVGARPSNVAAASIISAIQGLYPHLGIATTQVFAKCLRTNIAELQFVQDRLDYNVERASKDHCTSSSDEDFQAEDPGTNGHNHKSPHGNLPNNKQMSRQTYTDSNNNTYYSPMEQETHNDSLESESNASSSEYDGYDTPNDIHDINFSD